MAAAKLIISESKKRKQGTYHYTYADIKYYFYHKETLRFNWWGDLLQRSYNLRNFGLRELETEVMIMNDNKPNEIFFWIRCTITLSWKGRIFLIYKTDWRRLCLAKIYSYEDEKDFEYDNKYFKLRSRVIIYVNMYKTNMYDNNRTIGELPFYARRFQASYPHEIITNSVYKEINNPLDFNNEFPTLSYKASKFL